MNLSGLSIRALHPTFLGDNTFAEGIIHKLITVDTPHLGSELAADLGAPGEKSGCAATFLARFHSYTLNSAVLTGGITFSGAMADLSPGSFALFQIANQSQRPIPTAFLAGVEHNFLGPGLVGLFCSAFDPLALADTSDAAWSATIFNNQSSDAIVSTTSQLDGIPATPGSVFSGVTHSLAILPALGFGPPSVLSPDAATAIPSAVITLLNTSITNAAFNLINP